MKTNTNRAYKRKGSQGQPHTHSPSEFASRTFDHARTDANLAGIAATDSLKPWDRTSDTYSLVDTRDLVNSAHVELETLLDIVENGDEVALRILAQANIVEDDNAYDVFDRLADTESPAVAHFLGSNGRVPTEILDRLVHTARSEGDPDLAYAVAGNSNASANALIELHRHPYQGVRLQVAENSAAPDDVLDNLAHDENELVANFATNAQHKRAWMKADTACHPSNSPVTDMGKFIPSDDSAPF